MNPIGEMQITRKELITTIDDLMKTPGNRSTGDFDLEYERSHYYSITIVLFLESPKSRPCRMERYYNQICNYIQFLIQI